MWPRTIDWTELRFGVEIEFMDADPTSIPLLPGWKMPDNEKQSDDRGGEGGGELQSPPLRWQEREQIREMLDRLKAAGARVTWSCGLHVHVGVEAWGEAIILPMVDAALSSQEALIGLFQTSRHRLVFSPPITPAMREQYLLERKPEALGYYGRPESHRCGINPKPWFDIGTVEIRYPNASLVYDEVARTVETCLRFVAAVGAGTSLPGDAEGLAKALGVPDEGYPPPAAAPRWHLERRWLEDTLVPVLQPLCDQLAPGGEILSIRPVPEGLLVTVEYEWPRIERFVFRPEVGGGWAPVPGAPALGVRIRRGGPEEAPAVQRLLHGAHAWNLANGFNFWAAAITLKETEWILSHAETYVLEAAGELKGTITLWRDGSLGLLGVDPAVAGKGYGARLLAYAEERAREKGWSKIQLDTPVTHPWLPAFYERHGYRRINVVHWEGKLYDSVIMEKTL